MLIRLNQFFNSLAAPFDESIMRSEDRDDVRLGKRIFVIVSLLMIPLATIGAILGIIGDSSGMIVIALSFAVISTINLITMRRTQNFSIHFSIWYVIVLILGLAWGVAFGGFRANFGNYWVAFLPLMMVILVFDQRRTIRWFLVFAGFTTLVTVLEPYVNDPDNAPSNVAFNNTYTVLMTAALILLTINYYKREKNAAQQLLALEQEKSERLLLNILPKQIAEVLKEEERTIADQYESASILFADLVGFTPMSAKMDPTEMVDMLNKIYSHFDTLADKYAVEKIRTIGDSYMVAAGVPSPRPDHAQALADVALDMLAYSNNQPSQNGKSINFRIGINSGPLVAGVIGTKKFHYDVWGDTVNTASRMESHGVAGKIQLTAATQALLKDEFECKKRGVMDIKGKGEMETWFLVGRKKNI